MNNIFIWKNTVLPNISVSASLGLGWSGLYVQKYSPILENDVYGSHRNMGPISVILCSLRNVHLCLYLIEPQEKKSLTWDENKPSEFTEKSSNIAKYIQEFLDQFFQIFFREYGSAQISASAPKISPKLRGAAATQYPPACMPTLTGPSLTCSQKRHSLSLFSSLRIANASC